MLLVLRVGEHGLAVIGVFAQGEGKVGIALYLCQMKASPLRSRYAIAETLVVGVSVGVSVSRC